MLTEKNKDKKREASLLNKILAEAISQGASAVHFEPRQEKISIRLRQKGKMNVWKTIGHRDWPEILGMAKEILGGKKVGTGIPASKDFEVQLGEQQIFCELSLMPVYKGEKMVINFKNFEPRKQDEAKLKDINKYLERSNGAILIVGPDRRKRLEILIDLILAIKKQGRRVALLENFSNSKLPGLAQIKINPKIGYDLEDVLAEFIKRNFKAIAANEVYQPKIIKKLFDAALAGHLIVATLPFKSATETFKYLRQTKIDPFLISAGLNAVIETGGEKNEVIEIDEKKAREIYKK